MRDECLTISNVRKTGANLGRISFFNWNTVFKYQAVLVVTRWIPYWSTELLMLDSFKWPAKSNSPLLSMRESPPTGCKRTLTPIVYLEMTQFRLHYTFLKFYSYIIRRWQKWMVQFKRSSWSCCPSQSELMKLTCSLLLTLVNHSIK